MVLPRIAPESSRAKFSLSYLFLFHTDPLNALQPTTLLTFADHMIIFHRLKEAADLVAFENATRPVLP